MKNVEKIRKKYIIRINSIRIVKLENLVYQNLKDNIEDIMPASCGRGSMLLFLSSILLIWG